MNCRALCNSNLNLTYRWSLEYYSNRAIVRHSRTEFHPPPLIRKNSLEWDICPTVWNEKGPYFKNLEKMLQTVFKKDFGCASCFQTIHGFVIPVWALLSLACHRAKFIQNISGAQNVTQLHQSTILCQSQILPVTYVVFYPKSRHRNKELS